MALNIKNSATEDKIRKLAAEMGVSLTEAVDRAVGEKLWSLTREDLVQRDVEALLRIARESAKRFTEADKTFDWDSHLYDENGLPK
jgi:hypothetical protein